MLGSLTGFDSLNDWKSLGGLVLLDDLVSLDGLGSLDFSYVNGICMPSSGFQTYRRSPFSLGVIGGVMGSELSVDVVEPRLSVSS